jgi:hypothetical protein
MSSASALRRDGAPGRDPDHDPDGRPAYCYNSEVAAISVSFSYRTARGHVGWTLRASVSDVELLLP